MFGSLVKPFYSMFGELFLAENTNYYFTDHVTEMNETKLEFSIKGNELGDFDDVVCTSTMRRQKFQEFQEILGKHDITLIRCPHKERKFNL